jgi:hypothetical protein
LGVIRFVVMARPLLVTLILRLSLLSCSLICFVVIKSGHQRCTAMCPFLKYCSEQQHIIYERRLSKVKCICGAEGALSAKSRHVKSKKHQDFIKRQLDTRNQNHGEKEQMVCQGQEAEMK